MIMVPTPGTTHLHDEPGAWGQHPGSGPSLFHLPVTLSPSQETFWPQFFIIWGFAKPQGSEGAERPVSSSAPHWWAAPLELCVEVEKCQGLSIVIIVSRDNSYCLLFTVFTVASLVAPLI